LGRGSGYRQFLIRRNQFIVNKFLHGIKICELSKEFHLSEETIKKIVYARKDTNKLDYRPTSWSASEYAEAGMLEEWIHTYLLFDRRNKVFSDGLRLQYRYYYGPVVMPLSLFQRSSGPEVNMKWRVHPTVFENKVAQWMNRIRNKEDTPPLIIQFENGKFEINCDNPLFEASKRLQVSKHAIIFWMTERFDHDEFQVIYANVFEKACRE